MSDTDLGPNIIKENFISRDTTVNHNNKYIKIKWDN